MHSVLQEAVVVDLPLALAGAALAASPWMDWKVSSGSEKPDKAASSLRNSKFFMS